MELLYIVRILIRKKWIILFASVFAVIVTFLLTMKQKKLFKSQAQISTGFTISEEIRLSNDNFNLPQIDVKFNNVIENINSLKVLSLLSYTLILRDMASEAPYSKPDESDYKKKPELRSIDINAAKQVFKNKHDSMLLLRPNVKSEKLLLDFLKIYNYDIESIKKNLYVSRFQRTDYINIFFKSESPELSAFVVDNLVKEFQRYYDRFRRERSTESMIGLDSISKKRKLELDEKINAKSRFLTDSVSSSLDPNLVGANKLSQIGMYESGLADELSKVSSLTYQISQIDLQLKELGNEETAKPQSNNSNNIEYFALRKEYNDLYDEYIRKGGKDELIKAKLDDLQRRMRLAAPLSSTNDNDTRNNSSRRSMLQNSRIDLEGKLLSANSKIGFYRSKLAEAGSILSASSPNTSGRLEQFDKEIEIATLEYTNSKERLTIAANMNDGGGANFKQTLYGQPALKPEPSKRLILMALAGFTVFVLTALVFIFISYLDQSIKNPSQFQRQTGLKLLGTINMINLKATNLKEQITQLEIEDGNRHNSFRELLRKLRYEIESSGKRIFLFTSTEPQQGKTTLLQSIAFSLSLSKKKVLLIDTNFCNNDLTVYNEAMPTLEEFSTAQSAINIESVKKIISPTGVPNVDIIGCKGGDYTPSEILPKDHLLNHLHEFLTEYDFILMEGAPLNGFTDTKELASYADGIVAIFSAKSEIKQVDKESIKYFQVVKDKFIGAVLNKVDEKDINL